VVVKKILQVVSHWKCIGENMGKEAMERSADGALRSDIVHMKKKKKKNTKTRYGFPIFFYFFSCKDNFQKVRKNDTITG